jgi:2-oxoglutarate decarboxylase
VPEQPLSSDPQSTFGPNEWLVDELYESYLKDRNSVDKAWWDFFKDYEPGEATYGRDYAVKSNHTPAAATSAQGNGAAPKAAPAAPADPAPAGQPATSAAKPAPAAPAAAPVTKEGPTRQAKAAPVTTPTPNPTKEPGTPSNPSAPMPRDMDKPKTQAAQSEGENLPIRGASARVVTNMEASLAVPTATSVRAVRPSCSSTTGSSSTTTCAAAAAARSVSRTSSATPWSRPSRRCRR